MKPSSHFGAGKIAAIGVAVVAVAVLAVGLVSRDAPDAPSPEAPQATRSLDLAAPEAPATRSLTIAPTEPAPAGGRSERAPLAQTYSAYCQTSQGVCVLPSAEPIGSTCVCNGVPGRVIP
jgi:hypothetical protein